MTPGNDDTVSSAVGLPHVADPIRSGEAVERSAGGDRGHCAIDARMVAMSEKHRAGLRAQCHHVPRPIVFLVAPGALVLLDDVAIVLVEGKAGGNAKLLVLAHAQPV